MYFSGCNDYLCPVDINIASLLHQYSESPTIVCSEFKNLADAIILEYNIPTPSNFCNALQVYFYLVIIIQEMVN